MEEFTQARTFCGEYKLPRNDWPLSTCPNTIKKCLFSSQFHPKKWCWMHPWLRASQWAELANIADTLMQHITRGISITKCNDHEFELLAVIAESIVFDIPRSLPLHLYLTSCNSSIPRDYNLFSYVNDLIIVVHVGIIDGVIVIPPHRALAKRWVFWIGNVCLCAGPKKSHRQRKTWMAPRDSARQTLTIKECNLKIPLPH